MGGYGIKYIQNGDTLKWPIYCSFGLPKYHLNSPSPHFQNTFKWEDMG